MPLTDLKCKNAKPEETPYKLADGGGLYLWVTPAGNKLWRQKYRVMGKEKILIHGSYPEIPLIEARRLALEAKEKIKEGHDPNQLKKEDKLLKVIRSAQTFEAVAREWHKHNTGKWAERHAQNVIRRLEKDAFPMIGNLPISDITAQSILALMKKIEKRGAHDIARRTLQMCSQVFTYAVGHGLCSIDPTFNLNKLLQPYQKGNFPAIEPKEIREFMRAVREDVRMYPQTKNALRFLMLTAVRTIEMRRAKWEQFDFEHAEWDIPWKNMKMKRAHKVPLSRQVMDILKSQKELVGNSEFVFPSMVKPNQPISEATVLNAIKRMGYNGRMSGHGFRALFMTASVERLKSRSEAPDKQLAHKGEKVQKAYQRSDLFDERKELMQKWADYLDQQDVPDSVIPLLKDKGESK